MPKHAEVSREARPEPATAVESVEVPKAAPAPPQSAAASALGGAADKRPVETWAEAKGLLPMNVRGAPPGVTAINPEYWKFAAARALRRWQDGQLVTEAEFDEAVTEQMSASHR